jgi:2-keto-4-pentenoate hydratase/2-oxohepta-3-ene-1,7-dioic acid hydratase in catechol pathway
VRFGTLSGRLVLVREHAALDVGEASGGRFPADVTCALERWEELRAWASQADWSPARPLDEAALGPPVPLPRQVFAVALNYRPHAAEAGFAPPSEPLIFTKFPSCITGPYGSIALPDGRVDWEIERGRRPRRPPVPGVPAPARGSHLHRHARRGGEPEESSPVPGRR